MPNNDPRIRDTSAEPTRDNGTETPDTLAKSVPNKGSETPGTSDDPTLISTRDIRKRFGEKKILNGIDLDIRRGERIVIIGPSGSGKSTFLRCLNLLEPPTTGKIYFEGNLIFDIDSVLVSDEIALAKLELTEAKKSGDPLFRKSESQRIAAEIRVKKADYRARRKRERALDLQTDQLINVHRQKIGMVFQQFNLFPHLTVLQNIMLSPVQLKKLSPDEAKEKAMAYLGRIGLQNKAESYPSQLSGGQQQRIAIVRSLVMNPDVMLFDEPTSALDPEMVGEVLDFIQQLAGDGMTMAIVTHEMNFAREIGTRVLFMDDGKILEQKEPISFFREPENPRLRDFLSKVLHSA